MYDTAPEPLRHLATLISRRRLRDWFRKTYWVRCWKCTLCDGPYFDLSVARDRERYWYGYMQTQRPECRSRQERAVD